MDAFAQYILRHENDDIARLLLSSSGEEGIDLHLAADTLRARRVLNEKVPSFYRNPALVYPGHLCVEQCSSEDTARFKAGLALQLFHECGGSGSPRIADLTGGLGVDAWAFSSVAQAVLHNEANAALSEAVLHNFEALGISNVRFCCYRLAPSANSRYTSQEEASPQQILGDFRPDILFLDPARRDDRGGKVFRLQDCSPNILELKDALFSQARFLFLKLSPMADLQTLLRELGPRCRVLCLVGSKGECKEVLVWMERKFEGVPEIRVREAETEMSSSPETFRFTFEEEKGAPLPLADSMEEICTLPCLFEPGKALLKSGAFKLIALRFGLKKLAASTHLYLGERDRMPLLWGKAYEILEPVQEMSSRSIKETGKRYPEADVTARNLPLSSDDLRKKLKKEGKSGGEGLHLFAATCECLSGEKKKLLLLTRRIRP